MEDEIEVVEDEEEVVKDEEEVVKDEIEAFPFTKSTIDGRNNTTYIN